MTFDMNWGGGDYPQYAGEMKGSDTANAQRKEELAMQKDAYATQKAMIDKLSKAFSGDLSGKNGFDPQTLALMKSSFLNSNDATFNQAGGMVREALGARGNNGTNPGGGDFARGLSGLLSARAGSQSQGLLGVDIQNAQQAINNKFNAGSILSGNAATLTGTQGVAGAGASSALNAYIQAANTGFLSSFANSFGTGLGGTLGQGIGKFGLGGLNKVAGGWGQSNSGGGG